MKQKMKILLKELKQWYFDLFYEQSISLGEFGNWICTTGELASDVFEEPDYLFLIETNFDDSFAIHRLRLLLKKYLPHIETECETHLLQRKLERTLQMPFLSMVEEIDDLRTFQRYPLTELGITPYNDADVWNFREVHPSAVSESVYEKSFPNLRKQINRVVDRLRTGEVLIVAEGEEGREKSYRYIDQRIQSANGAINDNIIDISKKG